MAQAGNWGLDGSARLSARWWARCLSACRLRPFICGRRCRSRWERWSVSPFIASMKRVWRRARSCAKRNSSHRSERLERSQRGSYFLAEQSDRAGDIRLRQIRKIELAHVRVEHTCVCRLVDFACNRLRRADENQIVLYEILGVEQICHDLGCAGLATRNEFFGMRAHPPLESLPRLRWRQEDFIGAAGPGEGGFDRLLVALIDIYDRAVGDPGFAGPACPAPVLQEFPVARRRV